MMSSTGRRDYLLTPVEPYKRIRSIDRGDPGRKTVASSLHSPSRQCLTSTTYSQSWVSEPAENKEPHSDFIAWKTGRFNGTYALPGREQIKM
jgi:hypothetical protein